MDISRGMMFQNICGALFFFFLVIMNGILANALQFPSKSPLGFQHHEAIIQIADFTFGAGSSTTLGSLESQEMVESIRRLRSSRGRTMNLSEETKKPTWHVGLKTKECGQVTERKIGGCEPSIGINLPYESAVQALRAYYNQNSDLALPRRFIVPEDHGKFSNLMLSPY